MSDVVATLAELVRRETGSDLPAGRLPFVREAAERRARAVGFPDLGSYVAALGGGELAGEWGALASLLTIKESSFFRVPQQWERIRTEILPALQRERAGRRRLRLWSAACAAGEEPATLAMILADTPTLAGWDWSILATDLDGEALARAERGLYGDRAVAAVPAALKRTWLTPRGGLWELDPRLRARIVYRRLNLARPPWQLPEERFDLVLLRNVLIYFRADLQRVVVAEVTRRLAGDGWLFLGGSETLWRIQERLVAIDLGGCFGYRLPRPGELSTEPRTARPGRPAPGPELPGSPGPGISKRSVDRSVGPVSATPAGVPVSAEERLLAAVAHLEADRPAEAERETATVLAADPTDPAARALSGLLHELAGRTERAAEELRAALYLEPDLVQVRLLLAGCLRRLGSSGQAERQLREVVATLERGGGRRLPLLDGRLLPDLAETLRRARGALAPPSRD